MKRIIVIALVICMLNSRLMAYADTETAFPILDEITVLDITEHSYTVKVVIKNASENTTVSIEEWTNCSRRTPPDGFAEQNGRDAEPSGLTASYQISAVLL